MQLPGNHRDQNVICSALLLSTGLSSSATLQRCLLKLISAFGAVLRVFAFFDGTGRRPLFDVDIAIALFILIDVDVAIILFIYTVYTSKLKVQQQLQ